MEPRHSFGGHALDRYVYEYEVPDGGGGDPPPDPAPGGDPAPAAVAEPPAAPAWSADDPAFLEAVDQRAAAIIEGRLAAQQPQTPPPPAGQPLDLNEFLNPFGEQFGQNLATWLSQRDEWTLGQFDEKLAPILTREQQTVVAQGLTRMDELIAGRWDEARDGALTDPVKGVVKDLAVVYLGEMEARYGASPMAAEQALAKAADTIRSINSGAHAAGAGSNADRLAALAAAPTEPGGGGGAINVPTPAKSWDEIRTRISGFQTPTSQ